MDYFLSELEKYLEEYNVYNKEEILEKYRKRYMFGIESGLTNYEIEEMLGTPESIAQKFGNKSSYDEKADDENTKDSGSSFGKLKNLNISVNNDDVIIERADVSGVKSKFVDCNPDNFFITDTDTDISILVKKKTFGFFSSKSSGRIIITIPRTMRFNNVKLGVASADIEFDKLSCNSIDISVVSGDAKFEEIESHEVKMHSVSGDIDGKHVDCNKIKIQTVSGDVSIKEVKGYNLNCDTISGNIVVDKTNCQVKFTKIAGSVKIVQGEF